MPLRLNQSDTDVSGAVRASPSHVTRDSVPYCVWGTNALGSSRLPRVTDVRLSGRKRYVSGVPQAAQKPRSAMSELLKIDSAPRVMTKDEVGTNAMKGAPAAFWHIRQWQTWVSLGSASRRYRTAPHWQPPVTPVAPALSLVM